ncbi:MAG TPA: hypothetical protein PKY15_03815 [Methanoregulaceae archaeon]|nr:hypothetical protein [Methanoregulaceae archaeon]
MINPGEANSQKTVGGEKFQHDRNQVKTVRGISELFLEFGLFKGVFHVAKMVF